MSSEPSESSFLVRFRGHSGGPSTLTELQRMVRRGTISRAHEISCDGITWTPAGDFQELFGGDQQLLPIRQDLTSQNRGDSASDEIYYQQNGQVFGPMPPSLVIELAKNDMLQQDALVWKSGEDQPTPAYLHPLTNPFFKTISKTGEVRRSNQFPSPSSIAVVCGICFVLAVVGIFCWSLSNSLQSPAMQSAPMPANAASTPVATDAGATVTGKEMPIASSLAALSAAASQPEPTLINRFDDEARLGDAVGLVVNGVILERDGRWSGEMPVATGSCFAVTGSGTLLTNRHVVEGISEDDWNELKEKLRSHDIEVKPCLWVFFKKQKYRATVVYQSTSADLAIMHVNRHQPFFSLSKQVPSSRGENVYALGFPGDGDEALSVDELQQEATAQERIESGSDISRAFKDRDFIYSLETGVLSRTVPEEGNGHLWLQHGAILRHGNSGGPLIDSKGVVLAINTLLQGGENNVPINSSLELSQFRHELEAYLPGACWQ